MSDALQILVPVLHRPHRVEPLLASIEAATPAPWHVLFICDEGDEDEINTIINAAHEYGSRRVDYTIHSGNYASKINRGMNAGGIPPEPLMLFGADDLHFHPGWLEAATAKLTDGIGVVSTSDLCNPRNAKGNLATHPLVTREYAELGAIDGGGPLHEGYPHEYVDQEFTETAKHRDAFVHAPDSVVEHLHPDAGKAPTDELYDARPGRMRAGYRIYRSRRHLWA